MSFMSKIDKLLDKSADFILGNEKNIKSPILVKGGFLVHTAWQPGTVPQLTPCVPRPKL